MAHRQPLSQKELMILQEKIQPLSRIFDLIDDHIVITDSHANIIYANEAVKKQTGYTKDEIIGKTPGDVWGGNMPKEFYQQMWHTIKDLKKPFVGEMKNQRKDGMAYWQELRIYPILDDKTGEITFFIAIEPNITARKAIDSAKSEFVSLASHQLQTPMTAIRWGVERLLKTEKISLKGQEHLEAINQSIRKLMILVNQLLDISRIELGRVQLIPRPLELVKFIEQYLEELKVILEQKKLTIKFDQHPPTLSIKIDEVGFRNIIQSLVSNALEYTKPGGKITISLEIQGSRFLLTVSDNGIGIPKSDQTKLFQKFSRASNAQTMKTDGTGLGLYIVAQTIKMFGGKIWFQSQEGKGTSFFVELPIEVKGQEGEVGFVEHKLL